MKYRMKKKDGRYYTRLITPTQSGIIVMENMSANDSADVVGVQLTLEQIQPGGGGHVR